MVIRLRHAAIVLVLAVSAHAETPVAAPRPTSFPGQYASPPEPLLPVWPKACMSYSKADERAACLTYVASDFARLDRYAAANAALAPPAKGEHRVVLIGDSIFDRWSSPESDGFFPGKPFVNRGIGGQTSAQMLLRFRQDVVALRPEVVVILAGTNDIAGNGGRTTLDAIESNLRSMAELAHANGIAVVLGTVLPVCDCAKSSDGTTIVQTAERPLRQIDELNQRIARVARERGYVLLDYNAAMRDDAGQLRKALTNDGLHPNAAGYAVMGPPTERAVAAALEKRRRSEAAARTP
ncbi:MAG TPA: SGNH/GDSL hydrolase family protein [Candidatus Binatia bacterium]|nr:SGNH/GDSL hydrolase family protein [Candidatus Binatia bacterium]